MRTRARLAGAVVLAIAARTSAPARAQAEQEHDHVLRIATLRAQHAVIASQPMLISTMARDFRITDAGRAEVNEKLAVFQMRLDEAANLIEGLDSADAERWATRHDAVREAMRRVEDAREDAWDALEDAPMTDPTAAGA